MPDWERTGDGPTILHLGPFTFLNPSSDIGTPPSKSHEGSEGLGALLSGWEANGRQENRTYCGEDL